VQTSRIGLQAARSAFEATAEKDNDAQFCLAMTYDKLGLHADAETMFAKARTRIGDRGAFEYSEVYAQFGNKPEALKWLEVATRLRDPGLLYLKMDPLCSAIIRRSGQSVYREPRWYGHGMIHRCREFPQF
jgi:tetratricopeptide (TPR) repeat protein